MQIDISAMSQDIQYELISSTVIPRPIALITSYDKSLKDTTINIMKNGQFVIHMVNEDLGQAMNICAIDFSTGVSETDMAGLTLAPSTSIKPTRIVEVPVAFECGKITFLQISRDRNIVVDKVLMMHVRDGLFAPKTFYIDPEKYHPIERMFGQLYTRTRDHLKMTVPSYDDWKKIIPDELPGS